MTREVLVYEFISAGGACHIGLGGADSADLLEQGVAMRDAMLDDLAACPDVAVTVVCAEDAPRPGRGTPIHPRAGETAVALLARVSPRFDHVWVVAPESEGILERLHEAVGERRWLGCSAQAIHIAGSKVATRKRLAAHGIDVPAGFYGHPERHCQWVVKPDDGVGAHQVQRHRDSGAAMADLSARQAAGQPASLEEWIAGEALSLSLLVCAQSTEVISINRQRVAIDDCGTLRYLGVDLAIEATNSANGRALCALATRVTDALEGLNGFVGIDLVRTTSGRHVVIEINPRLTCAYVGLSARLGRNLAAQMLATNSTAQRRATLVCA